MQRLFFLLLLLPIYLSSYEFNPIFISGSAIYQHVDAHFRLQEDGITTVREELEDQNVAAFALSSEIYFPKRPYFYAAFQYGLPMSSSPSLEMTIDVRNNTGTIQRNVTGTFFYDLQGYFYDVESKLGYPLQIGPITLIPLIGIFYQKENLSRNHRTRSFFQTTSANSIITAFFGPKALLQFRWLMPLAGIQIVLEPWPFSFLRMRAGYDYRFGWFEGRSSYFAETFVVDNTNNTTTFRGFSQNFHENEWAFSHLFHLASFFGLKYGLVLSLFFDYEYWSTQKGTSASKRNQKGIQLVTTGGVTTSSLINERDEMGFTGFKKQIFKGGAALSYSF